MSMRNVLNAADAARPTVEVRAVQVRDTDGALLPRVSLADADLLVDSKWARWSGTGSRRHLTLTEDAPLRRLQPGSGDGTRRDRADHTCRIYKDHQPYGGPHLREFIPTRVKL